MAHVTVIRIPSLFAAGALTLSATPPIGLAYVAASIRAAGHDVSVIDGVGEAITQVYYYGQKNLYVNGLRIEEIIERVDPKAQFICVSFPFSHEFPLAKKVCEALKNSFPKAILIGGGEHISAMPEFTLKTCPSIDFAVLGEGEETIIELIQCLNKGLDVAFVTGIAFRKEGEGIRTARRIRVRNIDNITRPAWDLIPLETYLAGGYSFGVNIGRTIPLMATRGCPYQCTFCSNPSMWTTKWIARSPEDVVDEMESYIKDYGVQNFDFYDLTAIVKKDWTVKFCNLLIAKKWDITWQLPSGTRSEALDDEVTELLYASGCRNLSYAPESGSPEMLSKIKKKIDPDRMLVSMRTAVKNGINIKANMIVGFPGERLNNILESYWFAVRMAWVGVDDMSMWVFSAYPGSEIFDNLVKGQNAKIDLSDDYFTSLLSYSDLNNVVSWNEYFNNRQLKYMRYFGILLFYFSCYFFRPWRFFRTIKNVVTHKPQSRMEMIIEKAISRHRSVQDKKQRLQEKAYAHQG